MNWMQLAIELTREAMKSRGEPAKPTEPTYEPRRIPVRCHFPLERVMKKQTCTLVIVLVASVLLRERFAAQQRDLHVVATFGIQGVMERILPEYQRNSGQNVSIDYEESAVIQQQVASGKVFDLAILVPQVIDELINTGDIKAGTRTDIAKTSLGIGVRSGAPRHDIRTAEAVKETLLSARSITFAKVGSATPVIEKMIERLGIAGLINPKIVRADQAGRPADLVRAGKIDLVIAPAAAIVPVPGRRFSRSVAGGVSDVSRPDRRYWYAIRKTGWCQGTCRIH